MNKDSIHANKVDYGKAVKAGDFCFEDGYAYIYIILPGTDDPDSIQIKRGSAGGPRVWGWDGNEDDPTLTPSLHIPGVWHGFLRKGKLESC